MIDSPASPEPDPAEDAEQAAQAPARRAPDRRRPGVEGIGSLVGGGGSQVGTNGAMRARDVSRPR